MAITVTRRQLKEGAAQDLGLFLAGTATSVDTINHTLVIPEVNLALPDQFHLRDAFVASRKDNDSGTVYNRIVKPFLDNSSNGLLLDSGPNVQDDDPVGIYTLLSPLDWNDVVNKALEKLHKLVRITVSLDTTQNEYSLDDMVDSEGDTCEWVQSRTQILKMDTRNANGSLITLEGWGGVAWQEDGNSLKMHLSYIPYGQATEMVISARKPFAWPGNTLDTDQATTNVQYVLGLEACKEKALELVFNKFASQEMKTRFGAMLAETRQKLAQAMRNYVPPMRPQNYEFNETFSPDIVSELILPAWGTGI